jgi:hypothetical protein
VHVPGGELFDVTRQLRLPERRRDVQLAAEPDTGRYLLEELVD